MPTPSPHCALCGIALGERLCRDSEGKSPAFCPTQNFSEVKEENSALYEGETKRFAKNAAIQEASCYEGREQGYAHLRPAKPRIEEIIEFAQKMGYQKLGLAFCMGLRNEAKAVELLLQKRGFEVVSVICKVGNSDKSTLGIDEEDKLIPHTPEAMCDPLLQARLLNESQTDFNIMLGLCVGHDSLFLKASEALCTVFAVKDRLLGHNPLAAIYTLESYYRSLKEG